MHQNGKYPFDGTGVQGLEEHEPQRRIQFCLYLLKLKMEEVSVNVWAGVIGRTLIGPHFLSENLNSDNYLHFLQNDLPRLVEESGAPIFETDHEIIFQQDGCPAHWTLNVREHLNNNFPDSWIARDGPIPWPARSPDLTPLDFFVWARAKELVYTEVEINTREDLKKRINSAFETMK
ncbi:unnamed protein product [Colias eurytheme]|nr:unnamed protein product [Colias eurytheme]